MLPDSGPCKLTVALTLVVICGYSAVSLVVGGQILAAIDVTDHLSIACGVAVISIATWITTTFGYAIFHHYERYAWLPQLVALSLLAGVAGPCFDLGTDPGMRLSRAAVT